MRHSNIIDELLEGSFNMMIFKDAEGIKKDLDDGGPAYTIRVNHEIGKYELGKHYMTPWRQTVVVTRIQKLNSITKWEHASKLSQETVEQLSNYNQLEVIEIMYAFGKDAPIVDRSLARNQRYDALIV